MHCASAHLLFEEAELGAGDGARLVDDVADETVGVDVVEHSLDLQTVILWGWDQKAVSALAVDGVSPEAGGLLHASTHGEQVNLNMQLLQTDECHV